MEVTAGKGKYLPVPNHGQSLFQRWPVGNRRNREDSASIGGRGAAAVFALLHLSRDSLAVSTADSATWRNLFSSKPLKTAGNRVLLGVALAPLSTRWLSP